MAFDSSGYTSQGGGDSSTVSGGSGTSDKDKSLYWDLTKCKRAYQDFLGNKRDELDEQKKARRYRHGAHWTDEQIKVLNRRKQPIVTYNEVGRKANATVGQIVKLRLDPKCYPRTPQHQKGADLATAALRYVMDEADFKSKEPQCADKAYVSGISGLELELIQGDHGDPEIALNLVEDDEFFYDPRSYSLDFADALYMGVGKWIDEEVFKEEYGEEYTGEAGGGSDLTTNSDRDNKWFFSVGNRRMVRVVDLWYLKKSKWYWSRFTGSKIMSEGESPFVDEKGRTFCKYLMFSAGVDHDGDRYGPIRNLIPINDEINMRRSKALHELNSRRIIAERGSFDDVERIRLEASKPDGIILKNPGTEVTFDDQAKQLVIAGQMEMLKEASGRLESYGPNAALAGDSGLKSQSGRAIQLLQQAGLSELGPYFSTYKNWKIRLYRAVWNTIQKHWTSERWIRVTDDQSMIQFVQLNGMQVDPMTGMPAMVNQIGALDVDIILDEGPDTITLMQDVYETLGDIVPSIAKFVPPSVATALVSILVQNSPLPENDKKLLRDAANQKPPPPPEMLKLQAEQQSKQQELQFDQAKAAQDAQIEQQKMQGQMALKREETAANIQLKQQETAATIQLKREEAAAQMELEQQRLGMERERAAHEVDKSTAEMLLKTHSQKQDMEHSREQLAMQKEESQVKKEEGQSKLKMQEKQNVAKIKQMTAKVQETKEEDDDDALASALDSLAKEISRMNKPRNKKVRKNADGSFDISG